jgi:anti-sigma B factor antagonist
MLQPLTSYELELRTTERNGVTLVELAGELDLTTAPELERRLGEASDHGSDLVLDLNGVSFLDSAALHVLFRIARRFEEEDKRFGIVLEPTAPVARTLTIVGLDEVTRVRASYEDALSDPS